MTVVASSGATTGCPPSTVHVGVLLHFEAKEWIALFLFFIYYCMCSISKSQLLRTTSRGTLMFQTVSGVHTW